MNETKLKLIQSIIENVQDSLDKVHGLLSEIESGNLDVDTDDLENYVTQSADSNDGQRGEIIEGVFDGYQMIGPDGSQYSVPANYASKSKLVEGDLLKLTIAPDGSFIYKQIKPIDRERIKGKLVRDKEKNEYRVLVDKKLYKVLLASVTYYKGGVGDEVIILVPKGGTSEWAAVDNIIKKAGNGDYEENEDSTDDEDIQDPFSDIFDE